MGVHPCRSREDTGGNPHYKMHLFSDDPTETTETTETTRTLCGLEVDLEDGERRHAFGSVCPACFPDRDGHVDDPADEEPPWTPTTGSRGPVIGSRVSSDGPEQTDPDSEAGDRPPA